MPTYEYVCESCGHRFEKSQSMCDKPLNVCPQCGEKVRRLIGAGTGIIFKGKTRQQAGRTCCGRTERCDVPPCSDGGVCKR